MDESKHKHEHRHSPVDVTSVRGSQFLIMVISVIGISMFLVYVALSLYVTSGTLQLDLSRPGYASAREEVIKGSEVFQGFSEDGSINREVLNEFDELYKQKAAEALIDIDAFSGDVLSDTALSLE
jgi:hypothetical protein